MTNLIIFILSVIRW